MFSNAPHHEPIYSYYNQLVKAERQSYESEKIAIATGQCIQEGLKELPQETVLLTYLLQVCPILHFLCWVMHYFVDIA